MHGSSTVSLVFCKKTVTKFPSQLHPLSTISMNMMKSIECEGESEFLSVTNMNHEQEGEALELHQQGGSNPSSNSLVVIKVTQ